VIIKTIIGMIGIIEKMKDIIVGETKIDNPGQYDTYP
jgi:hypothetical protein